jgi:hypothetical protein
MTQHTEDYYLNMTDRELVREVLFAQPDNFFAVQLALRLETQLDINDTVEDHDGDDT